MRKLISVLLVLAFMMFNIGVYQSHQSGTAIHQMEPQTRTLEESLHAEHMERESPFLHNQE